MNLCQIFTKNPKQQQTKNLTQNQVHKAYVLNCVGILFKKVAFTCSFPDMCVWVRIC